MGLAAASGKTPVFADDAHDGLRDRRLRSLDPRELIAGRAAARPIAQAQAYLAIGGGLIGALALALPHPPQYNVAGLLAIQTFSVLCGVFLYTFAGRIPFWQLRLGPALGTLNTTLAVYMSGDSTSAFAMFYLWVGLYVFYFPSSKSDAAFYVVFALAGYATALLVTPSSSGSGTDAAYSSFVILAGTLITAGTLLTYLRSRIERLLRRLTDAARTDPLTGLPNPVALQQVLEREVERAGPDQRPLSVLVVDIDRFQKVNERYGMGVGDQILQRLGPLLEEHTRLIDTVARSGGEEFVVVLPETDQHRAFLVAEELLAQIREGFQPPSPQITASVGVAAYPEHGNEIEDLLSAGDQALRAAKALGRDRPVIYSPEVTSTIGAATGRRSIETQAHLATVLSLAEALDQRDSSTAKHSQTVGRLSEAMARELGLDEERVQRLRLAGILHDIGKIGVPDAILRKPGPLSEQETVQMRRHPEIGARILSSGEMDDIRAWIRAHHERPDGGGYPKGLSSDEIPLEASILAVADAYEAMTADRVYRPSLGAEAAREELIRGSGTQFEPRVVQALLRSVGREVAVLTS